MKKFEIAKANPVLCPAPFRTVSIHNDLLGGLEISCCCNLRTDMMSDTMQTLRDNIQQGKPSAECSVCYDNDDHGIVSERTKLLTSMPDREFEDFVSRFEINEKEIFIRFSNHCMLACRSCDGLSSKMYAQTTGDYAIIMEDFSDDPASWQFVTTQLIQAHRATQRPILHLIGGEPLIQAGSFKTMQWLVDNNMAKDFTLRMTTSMAVNLSQRVLNLLKHFRDVWFVLSIDSVGENYHYVRWPAKFEKIHRNLTEEIPQLPNAFCILQPLWSLNNVFYLDQWLDYFHNILIRPGHKIRAIHPVHLNDPAHLALSSVHDQYRDQLIDYMNQCTHHKLFDQGYDFLKEFILGEIQGIVQEQQPDRFETFLKFTANFDKRTNTEFSNYNSKLWNILTDQHKTVYNNYYAQSDLSVSLMTFVNSQ